MGSSRISRQSVYIIGAQSTGKTTIINSLEASYSPATTAGVKSISRPAIVHETARTILKELNFTREDLVSSPSRALQMQHCILEAQLEAERAATADPATTWYISDRSGLDPIVYAQIYVGKEAAQGMLASAAWKGLEERMNAGIVFLCESGVEWLVDDGTRLIPLDEADWMRVDFAIRRLLEARGIEYTVIGKTVKDLQERVKLVQRTIAAAEG